MRCLAALATTILHSQTELCAARAFQGLTMKLLGRLVAQYVQPGSIQQQWHLIHLSPASAAQPIRFLQLGAAPSPIAHAPPAIQGAMGKPAPPAPPENTRHSLAHPTASRADSAPTPSQALQHAPACRDTSKAMAA